jgi:hypothetical protein
LWWGSGGAIPIGVNFSGLPLCKAGVWGMQSPQKYSFFFFFRGIAAKKK